ncbi:MAG: cell division protein CrgA [Bifidobacteriaceae bacterium]|jgi:hypothetical protein|nr:cell division protein CrgA [Bifidobacteriaceae bacterium]
MFSRQSKNKDLDTKANSNEKNKNQVLKTIVNVLKNIIFGTKNKTINFFNNIKNKVLKSKPKNKDGVEIIDADTLLRKAKKDQKDKLKMTTGKNPRWLVPTMCGLMLIGLIWIVVFYLTVSDTSLGLPIPIGNWNLLIGLVLVMAGFSLTTKWK